jgi:predicted ATPase
MTTSASTLSGPGGVGKTRLSIRVAEKLQSDFADGVAFVSLAVVTAPDLVLPTIAQTLTVLRGPRDHAQLERDARRAPRCLRETAPSGGWLAVHVVPGDQSVAG